jgi:16S rRNA U516 pseudouridylate synthase RsuA-like enzyme
MATKKPSIGDLVDKSMEGRNFDGGSEKVEDRKLRTRFKPSPKQAVMIRLDDGDYGILQRIAERKGTKASALIRAAVKDIIKVENGA